MTENREDQGEDRKDGLHNTLISDILKQKVFGSRSLTPANGFFIFIIY